MSATAAGLMSAVAVRGARRSDLPRLAPLVAAEAEHGLQFAPHVSADESFSWQRHVARKMALPKTRFLVAEIDGQLTGYLELRIVDPGRSKRTGLLRRVRALRDGYRSPSPVRVPARAIIEACFVTERTRRRGVGSALLRAGIDWARAHAVPRVELGVMTGNSRGRAFWAAQGFVAFRELMSCDIEGRRDGVDAVGAV